MSFLHTEVLEALAEKVRTRLEGHKDHMAKGVDVLEYREYVGRSKECAALLTTIDEVTAELTGEEDEEDENKRE